MTYQDAIDFLFPLHRFGIRPGLERTARLLAVLGDPHRKLGRVVHVAGTNGKGTVASATASIFRASGMKTALYTSPHLVDFTERMRIDGMPIPKERVAELCLRLRDAVVEGGYTFFEATTAIAFAWFAEEGVDVSVVETGMGGRLDATNLVVPDHVAITSIGLDHTQWLGETLEAIAGEKAAIIKKGAPVVTAVDDPAALAVLEAAAFRCGVPLRRVGRDARTRVLDASPGLLRLDMETSKGRYDALEVPLTGPFHSSNVALALMLAEDAGIAEEVIRRGLADIGATGYRARLELLRRAPDLLLDVSHNAPGMQATVGALAAFRPRYANMRVLLGLASDKDAVAVVRALGSLHCSFIAVPIPSDRSMDPEALAGLCRREGFGAVVAGSVEEGLAIALKEAGAGDLVLATGSFYLAGALL